MVDFGETPDVGGSSLVGLKWTSQVSYKRSPIPLPYPHFQNSLSQPSYAPLVFRWASSPKGVRHDR